VKADFFGERLHLTANFNVRASKFLFFGCLPVFRSANYQRKRLAVGVKKVVLLFLYIYGFFLGYLTLRINSLSGKSGREILSPNLAIFLQFTRWILHRLHGHTTTR
jgi:hypothetical protein